MAGSGWLLGVDIGGTFTDLILVSPAGALRTCKVSTTDTDESRAIVDGAITLLRRAGVSLGDVAEVSHATTIATNAILERKGARAGLITTAGFRDVLEIRRLRMPRLYDMDWQKPEPLIERDLRLGVPERLDANGQVVRDLDDAALRSALGELRKLGIEALAICFLHAYRNPEHEQRALGIIKDLAPELDISISSSVLPEAGEFERTSTTVINAYVRPVVGRYLARLLQQLQDHGFDGPTWVMQSSGGLLSAKAAKEHPIHIIESGPAAGVVGAKEMAVRLGLQNLITFDMGGTTAKASMIENQAFSRTSEYEVGSSISAGSRLLRGGGYLLKVPAIDIAEVGAGGGSLVWVDSGGSLRVGPESSGSDPGPVAYGRGGVKPTLTDANLLLGYLNPDALAGGSLPLHLEHARTVFAKEIAEPLGLSLEAAAYGARLVANSTMVRAVRSVSIERGRDPREFTLFAFGGNGGVHAVDVAREMEIRRVLIPPAAGVFSALGLTHARVAQNFIRSLYIELNEDAWQPMRDAFMCLERDATAAMLIEGFDPKEILLQRFADVRYVGQSSELTIPIDLGPLDSQRLTQVAGAFQREHEKTYGHAAPGDPVEIMNVRLTVTQGSKPALPQLSIVDDERGPSTPVGIRRVYVDGTSGFQDVPILSSRAQISGTRFGPFILEEYDATLVVQKGVAAVLDRSGNIALDLQPGDGSPRN